MESCVQRWFFPIHLSKPLRLPRTSDARSYEVLHLSRKIISANLKISGSKMQPLSGNQRPDLLTALMGMSLVLRLPRKMHLYRSCSNVPRLPSFLEMLQNPHILLTLEKVHNPLRLPRESTSEPPKVVREWCVLYILIWKCTSRHNSVHFFRHLKFQTWSEHGVLCTFWLRNVLHATTACTFSTSQLPKVVREWCVLYILIWKCTSRHNGVQFFISHLARWLRTRRFSEPTFRPSRAKNHWKNTVFRDFFLLTLSLLWSSLFCSSLFYFSLLSDSSPWLFPSLLFICPFVGSLTSKLPSSSPFEPIYCYLIVEFSWILEVSWSSFFGALPFCTWGT